MKLLLWLAPGLILDLIKLYYKEDAFILIFTDLSILQH